MKKVTFTFFLLILTHFSKAQNGLENIIVEKYYVSNESDTAQDMVGGILPPGSVTYRIYADMLPGFKFQAAFGIAGHELRLATSTSFFNNEDRGSTAPTYTKTQAANNTVMLDSWLSAGAGCSGNFGVLKTDDNAIANIINSDGILSNADVLAGTPLTSRDGLIAGSPQAVTFVGITSNVQVFGAVNNTGNLFSTFNGSWASLNGSTGPTSDNKVLIAQITTDGIFSFELNIQIGTPTGAVQQYVANNPTGNQRTISGLIYQNIPEISVNLKALLEGFYIGSGLMNASIDPVSFPDFCDTLFLQLAAGTSPYATLYSDTAILLVNGKAQFRFLRNIIGNSYFLVLHHRNSIESWSANAITITPNMFYDFSTNANKVFGNNQSLTADGLFYALYGGDISDAGSGLVGFQDGIVESQDYGDMENAVTEIKLGYVPEDVTGDGVVESADYGLMENNVFFIISVIRP